VGLGLPMALDTSLLLEAAPPEKASSAASLSETSGEFGVALDIATLGSLGAIVYCIQMASRLPSGIPATAAAHGSMVNAMVIATHLPSSPSSVSFS
jgi:DHA2 family multidrug resistance protein-like MFS transporter